MGRLKVLSYWNLNRDFRRVFGIKGKLKVLSYWNLNENLKKYKNLTAFLKVLAYWNLNFCCTVLISSYKNTLSIIILEFKF